MCKFLLIWGLREDRSPDGFKVYFITTKITRWYYIKISIIALTNLILDSPWCSREKPSVVPSCSVEFWFKRPGERDSCFFLFFKIGPCSVLFGTVRRACWANSLNSQQHGAGVSSADEGWGAAGVRSGGCRHAKWRGIQSTKVLHVFLTWKGTKDLYYVFAWCFETWTVQTKAWNT